MFVKWIVYVTVSPQYASAGPSFTNVNSGTSGGSGGGVTTKVTLAVSGGVVNSVLVAKLVLI